MASAGPASSLPIGVGTRVRLKGRAATWSYDAPIEITDYEPNRRFGFKTAIPGTLEFEGTWVFEPRGDATLLRASGEARLQGFWKLVESLFAGEAKKGEADELKTIKTIVEGGGPNTRSANVVPAR